MAIVLDMGDYYLGIIANCRFFDNFISLLYNNGPGLGGGTGRRARLKIVWQQCHGGSIPSFGTMIAFEPNRKESYTSEELVALHKQAEAASRSSLTSLDLPSAHSQISTMAQIRARYLQDCHTTFPLSQSITLRAG